MPQTPITSSQVQTITSTQIVGTVSISNGGTGANSASAAINNLMPPQGSYTGRYLTTDGNAVSWGPVLAGNLSGNTLAPSVVNSSLTTVGTLSSLALSGATTFGTNYTEGYVTVSATSTTTLNCALGNNFVLTMSTNITSLLFTNVPGSTRLYSLNLIVQQTVAGSKTLSWPVAIKWAGGVSPTLTAGANKTDVFALVTYDGGSSWLGFVAGQNF